MGHRLSAKVESEYLGNENWYRLIADEDIYQYNVKKGDVGGLVQSLDDIEAGSWIEYGARVYKGATVKGRSLIGNNVVIRAEAVVDTARLSGHIYTWGPTEINTSDITGDMIVTSSKILNSDLTSEDEYSEVVDSTLQDTRLTGQIQVTDSILNELFVTGHVVGTDLEMSNRDNS